MEKDMSLPMPQRVPERGFYYHYKHDPVGDPNNYAYEVLGVSFHTEVARVGEEHFIVYRPLYRESVVYQASRQLVIPCFDARPLEMWMGEVEVNGIRIPRFRKITDPYTIKVLEHTRFMMY